MILKLAWRELWRSQKELIIVFSTTVFAFFILAAVFALKDSSEAFILKKSRDLLASDLLIFSNQKLTEDKIVDVQKQIDATEVARQVSFLTMLRAGEKSLLASVEAIDTNYPLLGHIETSRGEKKGSSLDTNEIWADPEVFQQLGLRSGDSVKVGSSEFKLTDEIRKSPGLSLGRLALAPQIFIPYAEVEKLGLTQFGSQVMYRWYFSLNQPLDENGPLLKKLRENKTITVRTPQDSLDRLDRILYFFRAYVGIALIIISTVSFMVGFYFFQIFALKRASYIALYQILGSSRLQSLSVIVVQIFSLLILSGTIGGLLSLLLLNLVLPNLNLPIFAEFKLFFGPSQIIQIMFSVFCATLAFSSPILFRLSLIQPKNLIEDDFDSPQQSSKLRFLAYLIPFFVFFFLASVILGSWIVAALFGFLMILLVLLSLLAIPWIFRRLTHRARRVSILAYISFLNLAKVRFATGLLCFCLVLISTLGVLLINIMYSLNQEFSLTSVDKLPRFFVINLSSDDRPQLESFVQSQQCETRHLSPMVLGRTLAINGSTELSETLKNFPVRLSYRDGLASSERIVKGQEMPFQYNAQLQKKPFVSVEEQYARRNKIRVGDSLLFDVQGVQIEAQVMNLRRVKWASFQPNFFIQFQKGVLEEAPKTWIGNIFSTVKNRECEIQYDLNSKFPNISIIDVRQTLQRVSELTEFLTLPLRGLGIAVMLACWILSIGINAHHLRSRGHEFALLSVLGATYQNVRSLIRIEYGALILFSILFGSMIGNLAVGAFNFWVLETEWHFNLGFNLIFILSLFFAFWLPTHFGSRGRHTF